MNCRLWTLVTAGIVIVGCGGGGGSVDGAKPPTTVTSGPVEIRGTALVQSATSSPGATVYTITGDIVSATYHDLEPTIDETEIFVTYEDGPGGWKLCAISTDGRQRRDFGRIGDFVPTQLRVDPLNRWVYFTMDDGAASKLYRIPMQGGTKSVVLNPCTDFAITPSGTKIVYRKSAVTNGWWKSNLDGSSKVPFSPDDTHTRIWGCVSDVAARVATSGSPLHDLDINTGALSNDHSITGVTSGSLGVQGLPAWGFHYDGSRYLFKTHGSLLPAFCEVYTNPSYVLNALDVAPSPDGKLAAISTYGAPTAVRVTDGTSNTIVLGEENVQEVAWGPFVPARQIVGSGIFYAGAGAILFSEFGKKMPSVVVAEEATGGLCTLTKVSSDSAANVVYRLDCGELSKLYFANNPTLYFSPVVSAPGGLQGAFISFDSATGDVASVTTFARAPGYLESPDGAYLEGGEIAEVVTHNGRTLRPAGRVWLSHKRQS